MNVKLYIMSFNLWLSYHLTSINPIFFSWQLGCVSYGATPNATPSHGVLKEVFTVIFLLKHI